MRVLCVCVCVENVTRTRWKQWKPHPRFQTPANDATGLKLSIRAIVRYIRVSVSMYQCIGVFDNRRVDVAAAQGRVAVTQDRVSVHSIPRSQTSLS